MRRPLLALLLLITAVPALAGPRENVTNGTVLLCDADNHVCLRGSIVYYSNPRLIELRSRVHRASGPGVVQLRLSGTDSAGATRFTTLEVTIRGRNSEIANHKLITDFPDIESWQLESVRFLPGANADGNDR